MLYLQTQGLIRSTQIVGGTVTNGNAGPYTTNFTLSTTLINKDRAIIVPVFNRGIFGNSASGDYFKWSLTSTSNLEVLVFQSFETSNWSNIYFLVVEYFQVRSKVTASTNITGTSAGNFDVTITPPTGASLAKCIPVMTCYPLDNQGNKLPVSLTMTSTSNVRFIFSGCANNTSKPVQAEILFL